MKKRRSNLYAGWTATQTVVLAVAFVLFAFLSDTFAQPKLGILSGVNLANLRIDGPSTDFLDYNSTTGWKAGAMVEVPFRNTPFSLQFEPMYVKKGAEQALFFQEPDLEDTKMKLELDYLALPVLFKYSFGKNNIRPYVLAGPEAGFLLNAKQEDNDLKDDFKELDFGLSAGAGVDYTFDNGASIFLEGRYEYGLNNINAYEDSPIKLYNQGVQIMGGVRVPLVFLGNGEDCECQKIEGKINLGDLRFEKIKNNEKDLYIFTTLDINFSAFLDGIEGEKEVMFKYDTDPKKSFVLTKLTDKGVPTYEKLHKGELLFDQVNDASFIDAIEDIKEKDEFNIPHDEEKVKIDCKKEVRGKFGPIQIGRSYKIFSLKNAIDTQGSYLFVKIRIEGYLVCDNIKKKLTKEIQGYLTKHKEVEGAWEFRRKP